MIVGQAADGELLDTCTRVNGIHPMIEIDDINAELERLRDDYQTLLDANVLTLKERNEARTESKRLQEELDEMGVALDELGYTNDD